MPSIGLNSASASARRVTSDSGFIQRLGQFAQAFACPAAGIRASGGSNRRMHTGRPCHDVEELRRSRPAAWADRRASEMQRGLSAVSAKIISRMADKTVFLKEHVFGAAEPDPLGLEPAGGARHRRGCRRWRGCRCRAHCIGPVTEVCVKAPSSAGWQHFGSARQHLSGGAVDGDPCRPRRKHAAILRGQGGVSLQVEACRSDAPTMQGSPRPRADDGGVAGHAAAFGQHTCRRQCIPRMSSGAVSRRTRMQGSPCVTRWPAHRPRKTRCAPSRRRGWRRCRRTMTCRAGCVGRPAGGGVPRAPGVRRAASASSRG